MTQEQINEINKQRSIDSKNIKDAYKDVEDALRKTGKLLRTTEAGKYTWATEHKSAITGLRIVIEKLRDDVPNYEFQK